MSRIATISTVFEANLAPAKAAYEKFVSEVEGRPLKIPLSSGGGTSSTLGGLSVSSSSTPFSVGASSANPGFFGAQIAQQINSALVPALQAVAAAIGPAIRLAGLSGSADQGELSANRLISNAGLIEGTGRTPTAPGGQSRSGGGGGGLGSRSSFFTRGITRYAGAGFILREAFAAAEANAHSNIAYGLAENDPAAQTRAILSQRSGAPVGAGSIRDFFEDFSGEKRLGIERTLRDSQEQDENTRRIKANFGFRRGISERADIASTGGDYAREGKQRLYDYQRSRQELQDRSDKETKAAVIAHGRRVGQINQKYNDSAPSKSIFSSFSPNYQSLKQANENGRTSELGEEQNSFDSAVANAQNRYKPTIRDLQTILEAGDRHSARTQAALNITSASQVKVDRLRQLGLTDEADREEARGRSLGRLAAVDRNDAQGRFRAVTEGAAEEDLVNEQTARGQNARNRSFATSTAANFASANHDPLGASVLSALGGTSNAVAAAQPQDKLKALVEGISNIANIFAKATDREQAVGESVVGRHNVLAKLLAHDQVGADVEGIVSSGLQEDLSLRNAGIGKGLRTASLENSQAQLQLTQQNFLEGFHSTQIGQNFETGSARQTQDVSTILKDIKDGMDTLTQAIKDVAAGK